MYKISLLHISLLIFLGNTGIQIDFDTVFWLNSSHHSHPEKYFMFLYYLFNLTRFTAIVSRHHLASPSYLFIFLILPLICKINYFVSHFT
ncbi:hypothetical protein J3Q64DRAFT_1280998 [Phycomyces blakesleeanus]|uniref:Uncharacterized protein n=1 Tax=Phycomyces blakesleeanus TaxID=4837 RepID=A0ABR3AMT6_PHYBL